ncbi:hypothetical protein H5410_040048 [Solanum commersonii]|uniref:Uncharacterized protein n=1 Tax=Solanum commersonii TaxID=4109 RepID=A0A9J5XRD7_SOLCO|nr:hypothetical protein H5410_040048 [Solanum commersonii]
MEERQDFMIEEGLHQTMMFKLSHGAPDSKVLRSILPKHLGTKGNCLIGLLAPRQILLRFDQYEDYVLALSRSVIFPTMESSTNIGIFHGGNNINCGLDFFRNLSPDLFAKKSLLFIASAVGKPIAINKATQIKSRPSTTRVKVILDLMEKLPNCIRLKFVDGINLEIVYDNLPLYCNLLNQNNKRIDDTIEVALKGTIDSDKYQGYAREMVNEKRRIVDVDQSKTTFLDRQLVAATSEQNRVDSMDVDTSNIGVQTTTGNKCILEVSNDQELTLSAIKKIGLNLMSNATKNAGGTSRVEVDAPGVGLGQKLMGATGNFHDSEMRQDISNASRDLLCSNSFGALLRATRKQVRLTKNDNDLIQEKQVSPLALNSKLILEAPIVLPRCVIAKKNESRALVSNTIDLGEDSLMK